MEAVDSSALLVDLLAIPLARQSHTHQHSGCQTLEKSFVTVQETITCLIISSIKVFIGDVFMHGDQISYNLISIN